MKKTSIKRVVSSFLLSGRRTRDDLRVAVFHRVNTMPTFPSHWAPCSGSIETNDPSPWHAARRELREETNLVTAEPDQPGGLFVDVPFRKTEDRETIIRVYPFTVRLPPNHTTTPLELRGTEHDYYKFVSVSELETLEPSVPGLARAFHHATFGRYLASVPPPAVREWAADRENGAAVMAQNALRLVSDGGADPDVLIMLRPSMVAITNALRALQKGEGDEQQTTSTTPEQLLQKMQDDVQASIDYAVQTIQPWILQHQQDAAASSADDTPYVIATHSRSSTVAKVLQRLLRWQQEEQATEDADNNNHQQNNSNNHNHKIRILCGTSTPGDEGVLMARDIPGARCVSDAELQEAVRTRGQVHLVLTGCDCLTQHAVVNKVGTNALVDQIARSASSTTSNTITKVVCCVDRWKELDDIFPPPLEDIFECVPREKYDYILLPPSPLSSQCEATNG